MKIASFTIFRTNLGDRGAKVHPVIEIARCFRNVKKKDYGFIKIIMYKCKTLKQNEKFSFLKPDVPPSFLGSAAAKFFQ